MAEIWTRRTEEMTSWRVPVLAAVLALAIGASGCVRMFGSPQPADEDVQFARSFLALFGARSIAAIEMGMDPAGRDPQLRLKTLQMASIVPTGTPSAVHLVASSSASRERRWSRESRYGRWRSRSSESTGSRSPGRDAPTMPHLPLPRR
jgi:hypothetical protein